ncbi:hypothetical protein AB0A95_13395 [Micromonospora sp. NPDC049230]|uniref:hypothetical protein n=1 Tax=Micromonospora sp. NPDC049230 TaxID=3155502 RepID=UPI0033C2A227
METGAGAIAAWVPDPAELRRRVARGRGLVVVLDETVTMEAATAAARTLRVALQPDMAVFASLPVSDVDADPPESVRYHGATWYLYPHGEHCQFENSASGEVVEANIYAPDLVDPYFLLQYAKTSGRHGAIVDSCAEGFHDMCRLLDHAGIAQG